jgi:hypothetical protein
MCLASDDASLLDTITRHLSAEFKIRDLGPVEKYVGLYIVRDLEQDEMWVHQAPYVSKIVEKYNISTDTCPETPLPYTFILETPQEYAARLLAETTRKAEKARFRLSGRCVDHSQLAASSCEVGSVPMVKRIKLKKSVSWRDPLCDVREFTPHSESPPSQPVGLVKGTTLSARSEANLPLSSDEFTRYQQIVGALNYIAHATRVDIAFAVNQLSRATHYACKRHLAAAEHCVRYLAGTATLALHYSRKVGMSLECFVDASYSQDVSKRGTTGLVLLVAGGPVYWTARKQDKIMSSTCDSESHAVQTAVQYVEFTRDLL